MTDDWNDNREDWQQGPRQEPTFKQDLGGFFFYLSMVVLIGLTTVYAWQAFGPQPVIRIEVEQVK